MIKPVLMKKTISIFICLIFILTLFPYLSVQPVYSDAPLPQEISLGEADDGRQLEASVGQVLVVSLPASPSMGYTWDVTDIDEKVLRQVGKAEFVPDKNMPGSPGKMIMRFEVVGDGSSSLNLVYHRPWKKDDMPARKFATEVVASAAVQEPRLEALPLKKPISREPKIEPFAMELPSTLQKLPRDTGPSVEPAQQRLPTVPSSLPGGKERIIPQGSWSSEASSDNSKATTDGLGDWQVPFYDGFEGSFPGSAWTLYDNPTWGKMDYRKYAGTYSVYCAAAGSAGVSPPGPYPHNMNAWMVAGPFDLSDAVDAYLSFAAWLKTESGYDWLYAGVSVNGGTYFYGNRYSGEQSGFYDIDLKNVNVLGDVRGYRNVYIAFWFQSDSTVNNEGVYVDEVYLQKNVGLRPALPSSFDWRTRGGVTDVRTQWCGDCWAHATVASLESNIKIFDGKTENLSEQYLVSCNTDGWNCISGGWFAHNYHQWKRPPSENDAGAVMESRFPYAGSDVACCSAGCPYPHPYKLITWGCIRSDVSPPSCMGSRIAP
ncbi:MAG: hypothetical protein FJ004_11840, partial [Chloroflexi bacterium]|nr:hypothetical protein [Chloroflexota bacterium]